MQLPNLRLYLDTVGLSWIQEWVKLENNRLLSLEGYNLIYDWDAYLLHEKLKSDKYIKDHVIRKVLILIWQRYKYIHGEKIPMWKVPLEVVKQKIDYGKHMRRNYGELIYW